MTRRSHGGGGGWRSWWFELGSFGSALYYTSRAKSASSPSRRGTPNATLRGEGLRRPLLAASLRVGDLRGARGDAIPIHCQRRHARQSLSETLLRHDAPPACSSTLRVSSTGIGKLLLRRCGAVLLVGIASVGVWALASDWL